MVYTYVHLWLICPVSAARMGYSKANLSLNNILLSACQLVLK